MAIKEFPDVSPDANATFGLEENTTEFNSVLTKTAQHMTLPGAKWRGSVSFTNRSRQEANKVKAFKASLGGKAGRFYLTPFDAYQNGTMSGTGVVDGAVASGVGSLPTDGWEGGQDALFEAGDYIEVNGELKMVTGDVSAPQSYIEYTGTNYMPSPFDPSGWTDGGNGTVDNVTLDNPTGSPVLGLAVQDGASFFTMQDSLLNGLSVVAGEKLYIGIILKPVDANPFDIAIVIGGSVTPIKTLKIAVEDLSVRSSKMTDYQITDLGNGFKLFQAYFVAEADDPDTYGRYTFTASNVGTVAPIGSQVYAQASYFGKAEDYPAQLLATADIPIAPPLRKALTGGESIITNEPKGRFYLGSNDQSWSINVNGVQDMGFDFIEDIN